MTPPKLTMAQQYLIWQRLQAGENTSGGRNALAVEFGVSETLIRRISKKDPDDLRSAAGIVELERDTLLDKPRVRVKASGLKIPLDAEFKAWLKDNKPVDVPSSPHKIPLVPLGEPIEPIGLSRKYGSLQSVTSDGALIVHNSDGTPVKILSCPVYNRLRTGTTITRHTVDITDIKGKFLRGEAKRFSGETIPGDIIVYGVAGSKTVSRVEFYPDRLPKDYIQHDEELRKKAV